MVSKLLYRDHKGRVQNVAGESQSLRFYVFIFQGSAVSPIFFIVFMGTLTQEIHYQCPTLVYADGVSNSKATRSG